MVGFPGGSEGAVDPSSIPGLGRSPGEGKWQPTPVFLPWEYHGQRSLAGRSPWVHKKSEATEWLTLWVIHAPSIAEQPKPSSHRWQMLWPLPAWIPRGYQGQNSEKAGVGSSREQVEPVPSFPPLESAAQPRGRWVVPCGELAHSNYVCLELQQAKPLTFISKNGSFGSHSLPRGESVMSSSPSTKGKEPLLTGDSILSVPPSAASTHTHLHSETRQGLVTVPVLQPPDPAPSPLPVCLRPHQLSRSALSWPSPPSGRWPFLKESKARERSGVLPSLLDHAPSPGAGLCTLSLVACFPAKCFQNDFSTER